MSAEPSTAPVDSLILNNSYDEPRQSYPMAPDGSLDYSFIKVGRHTHTPDAQVLAKKVVNQKGLHDVGDLPATQDHLINGLSKEVGQWRLAGHPNTAHVHKRMDRRNVCFQKGFYVACPPKGHLIGPVLL